MARVDRHHQGGKFQSRPEERTQRRIGQQPTDQLPALPIGQQPTDQLALTKKSQRPTAKFRNPFTLSWTHYVELLPIKDPAERRFYEIESTNESWSLSELKRQKASCPYERLALSRNKAGIKRLAREGNIITKPEDLFKEPVVLEFLGLGF